MSITLAQLALFVSLVFSFQALAQITPQLDEIESKTAATNDNQNRSDKISTSPLKLENVPARVVVKNYQQLTGRTLIFSPHVQLNQRVTVHFEERSTTIEKAQAIKAILATNEVVLKEVGDRFAFVVHPAGSNDFSEILALLNHLPGEQKRDTQIRFENAPSDWVFRYYSELTKRKLRGSVRAGFMSIETGDPITKTEAIVALEALVMLHNLRIDRLGEDSFEVVERARERK